MTPNPNLYAPEALVSADSIRNAIPTDVSRVLGKYGMTHPLLDGLDTTSTSHADTTHTPEDPLATARARARAAKEARLGEAGKELLGTSVFDAFERSHVRLSELYGLSTNLSPHPNDVDRSLPPMDDPELIGQLSGLRDLFEAYEQKELRPEIVISPEGLSLQRWQALFSSLRHWQDTNHPDSLHRLTKQNDGDGLWVGEWVRNNWDKLQRVHSTPATTSASHTPNAHSSPQPRHTLWVIPGTLAPPFLYVAHDGTMQDGSIPPDLQKLIELTPRQTLEHPTIAAYLTLQATRLIANEEPLDSATWTWLAGETGGSAPIGRWFPGSGQVGLRRNDVGRQVGVLGARPAGRR